MELNNIKECNNIITYIEEGSIAEKQGIQVGDVLISINDRLIVDIIDYMFMTAEEHLKIVIKQQNGALKTLMVQKEFYDPLGIDFENPIMDEAKSCRNQCVFCFIDQMPAGMRDTLYFKDDDSRLSFLQGNFVTLTNLSDQDLDRMIEYNISPINVSIHTTDPELRVKMLNNRFSGNILERLKRLTDNRIEVNGQIVLCPDYNDGEALDRTIRELSPLFPGLQSVAIVPVGLTKYRENLAVLRPFTKEESLAVIEQVHTWQDQLFETLGTRFVFLSDEFYVTAGIPMPEDDTYEGYIQLENGVGLMRKFETELVEALEDIHVNKETKRQTATLATGASAYDYMKRLMTYVEAVLPLDINVVEIKNDFFGHTITVAGLIVGNDLMNQLKVRELGDQIIIPRAMMKADEEVFLDNVTVEALSETLNRPVRIVEVDGWQFVDQLVSWFGIHVE